MSNHIELKKLVAKIRSQKWTHEHDEGVKILSELMADREMLEFALRPGSSIGLAKVDSVNGRATWYFQREYIEDAMIGGSVT